MIKEKCINSKKVVGYLALICLAIIMRLLLFYQVLGDYRVFLSEWWEIIKANGGILALKDQIGDYSPPYIFLLSIGTYFTNNSLFYIKILSCVLDFVLAFFVYLYVKKFINVKKATIAFFLVVFSAGVIINSAACAQCDVIYTLFVIMFVYFICSDKKRIGLICYGIALSFKLQAIFVAPIFLYLLLTKKIKVYDLIYCIFGFLVFNIPSLILGRNLFEIIYVYVFQSSEWPGIVRSAPNFYALFNLHYVEVGTSVKIILTACVILLTVLIVLGRRKKLTFDNNEFLIKVTILSLLVPFFLPGMMDRYFYLANIFVILVMFLFKYNKRKMSYMYAISCLSYSIPVFVISYLGSGYVGFNFSLLVSTIGNMFIICAVLRDSLTELS